MNTDVQRVLGRTAWVSVMCVDVGAHMHAASCAQRARVRWRLQACAMWLAAGLMCCGCEEQQVQPPVGCGAAWQATCCPVVSMVDIGG